MFCPNCGTKNEDDSLFCASCGTNLQDTVVPTVQENAPVENPVQPEAQAVQPEAQTVQPEAQAVQPEAQAVQPEAQTVQPEQQPVQPVYNGGFNPQQPQPAYNAAFNQSMVQPKAPVKINPLMIVTIVEAAVLVIAIAAFVFIGKNTYSYEKVAKQYFQAVSAGDWESAYDQLDISESEFIDKEHFIAANENSEGFEINQSNVVSKYDSGINANVTIQYSEKGSGYVSTMDISLNKQAKKKFLFFDQWRVSSSQFIAKDYTVYTSHGATLYLDGEEVPSGMITSDDEYGTTYTIPRVFRGRHTLSIEMGDFVGAEQLVYVDYDDDYDSINNIYLSQSQQEELIELAYTNMQAIINAAVQGDDFSAISNIYSADVVSDAEDEYEDFLEEFASSGEEEGILSITLSDVEGEFYYNYFEDGKMYAEVSLDYDYSIHALDEDWWYGTLEEIDYDSYDYDNFYFVYEDGEWKMTTYYMPYFYYY